MKQETLRPKRLIKEAEDKAEEKPAPVAEPVVDNSNVEVLMSPAAKKLVEENSLDANSIKGSGKDGRVTKEDVLQHLESASSSAEVSAPAAAPVSSSTTPQPVSDDRAEERVPMTRLRAKVAERLLQATNTTAMLTTFNEVNMQPVMDLRNKYKEMFEKKHEGTRLGFMSFFV